MLPIHPQYRRQLISPNGKMRVCNNCKKEKPLNEFRGDNKNCSLCIDTIKNSKSYKDFRKTDKYKISQKKAQENYIAKKGDDWAKDRKMYNKKYIEKQKGLKLLSVKIDPELSDYLDSLCVKKGDKKKIVEDLIRHLLNEELFTTIKKVKK